MLEPTAPVRLAVVALAASGLFLTACQREPAKTPVEATPAVVEAPEPVVGPQPLLTRSDLLRAVDAATSAYAAGGQADSDSLVGRRFVVRQPFGCAGSAPIVGDSQIGSGSARWSWSADRKAIQIALMPGDWRDTALLAGAGQDWEAAEGFWLSRPWLRTEDCPAITGEPLAGGPPSPSEQTVGLVAVFEKGGSRLDRRNGRAYTHTVRGDADQAAVAPSGGYRLVLEGRLVAFGDGRAIRCRAAGPDQRPVCVAAAQIDRIAFEDVSGAPLSEWRPS